MIDLDALMAGAPVWDTLFPATPACGTFPSHFAMLERMRASGYGAVSLTLASDPEDMTGVIKRLALWYRHLKANADRYRLLLTAEDFDVARAEGRMAVGFHFQGTVAFGRDLGMVELYHRLGVRHALMAYNQRNDVADGCHERTNGGLSRFGQELVAEMQRVGIVVDCTHTGERSARDVFEIARAPVIYSHSNAAALKAHERNIPDEMARECAATGGVVGINGIGLFLGDNDASTELLFRHLDHWVQLLGPAHVGIGLDTVSEPAVLSAHVHAAAARYPAGMGYETPQLAVAVPEQIRGLAQRMIEAGYAEADIRAILGGNWQRVARQCWGGLT